MKTITIGWRKGKRVCCIVWTVSFVSFIAAYCIIWVLPVGKGNLPSHLLSPTLSTANAAHNTSEAPVASHALVLGVAKSIKVVEEALARNSVCGTTESRENLTHCSSCLRSGIGNLARINLNQCSGCLRPGAGNPRVANLDQCNKCLGPGVGHLQGPNVTKCSGCLRPAVGHFQLLNITSEDSFRHGYNYYFKTAPRVVQNLITDYAITPALDCPYLLAVQASVKDRPEERDLVRRTWGSVVGKQTWPNRSINAKVKLLFVVGNMNNMEPEKQANGALEFQEVLSESLLHNDILYLNMNDNYNNLTLKLLSAFKWVKDNCPCVKFVLKVDFDTFVNVPFLVDTLLHFEKRLESAALGMVYEDSTPVERTGRWRVPEFLYPLDSYPQYASGTVFVIDQFNVYKQW